jgi:hypothetical protein
MSGGLPSVKVVLRNPVNYSDQVDYTIRSLDNELSQDWIVALKELLQSGNLLEKNFCFMGFPKTARNLKYLCFELDQSIDIINSFFGSDYHIDKVYSAKTCVAADMGPNHLILNQLHNHFERLQGTVENLSNYYLRANYETKYAIRQLNNICHEMESLILSQRKAATDSYWTRPSQITTFLNAKRYDLKNSHRTLFLENGYDRMLGGVYMHWAQIGKTYFEVWRDEGAPKLTDTVCEAITELKYYSGEFDIEWGNDVTYPGEHYWHNREQEKFRDWLIREGMDPGNPKLSLGYLPIGYVDLDYSFGYKDHAAIWDILSSHLDIYKIEVDGVSNTFDYSWADPGYKDMQIDMMKPGYDYSSRGR